MSDKVVYQLINLHSVCIRTETAWPGVHCALCSQFALPRLPSLTPCPCHRRHCPRQQTLALQDKWKVRRKQGEVWWDYEMEATEEDLDPAEVFDSGDDAEEKKEG